MDHERFRRHRCDDEVLRCGADEHEAVGLRVGRQASGGLGSDVGPERESGQHERLAVAPPGRNDGQRVVDLAVAVIPRAGRGTDAAEVEAHAAQAALHEGTRQGLDDLVLHRAAVLGVRVAHDGDAAQDIHRLVDGALDRAGRSVDRLAARAQVHAWLCYLPMWGGSTRRSTTSPRFR
jgi:hypothetical protein